MSSGNSGCLYLIIRFLRKLFGLRPPLPPYQAARFLSPAELAFYHILRDAVGDMLTICVKVRIADVIAAPRSESYRLQFSRISSKHFDFVLCTPQAMVPVAFVELDDSSHLTPAAQKSDAFKDATARQAGIPLFRFPVRKSLTAGEVHQALAPVLFPPKTTRSRRR
ncbi:MAG: hypothetical protein JWM59_3447 [Verrucomicrobiales bacterium]|nr:hypothetical protein [Verrucomicrobiales bacterium]